MSEPIAYLLTFVGYGTWLHGDERTSTDDEHNIYGTPKAEPNVVRAHKHREDLPGEPVTFDAAMRGAIDEAIREVCTHRGWILHALNVRTNHVHAVVSAPGVAPEKVMSDFKAYATRVLRKRNLVGQEQKVWAYHGSMPRIWKPEGLARAIRYVNEAQGPELPML